MVKDFFLRIITTPESMAFHPDIPKLYTHLAEDMVSDLNKRLSAKSELERQHVDELVVHSEDYRAKDYEYFSTKLLAGPNSQAINKTVCSIEDEGGKAVSFLHFTINDPDLIRRLKIQDEELNTRLGILPERNFFFLDDAVTLEEYKGRGFMSLAFDKILTMVQKRLDDESLEVCISMSAVQATKEIDESKVHHVINLPTYYNMLKSRASRDGKIYLRPRAKIRPGSGYSDYAEEIIGPEDLSEEIVSTKVASYIPIAMEKAERMIAAGEARNFDGVGAYISLIDPDSTHERLAEVRKVKRIGKFNYEKLTEKGKGWDIDDGGRK